MPDTAALQAAFAQALATRDAGAADVGMLRGSPARARRRLAFYRGNVQANAHRALRNAYPVCERLVGEDFFRAMARVFAERHPSKSGDLNAYGAELPSFIRAYEPAGSLAYLPDIATLEWQVHRAHYAADHPPLDVRGLGSLSSDRFGDLAVALHPACALLTLATPAVSIWSAHQPGSDGTFDVDAGGAPERALVHRPLYRVEVAALDAAAFVFLAACSAGGVLDAATRAAQAADPGFALDAHLARWVRDRVIVELRHV